MDAELVNQIVKEVLRVMGQAAPSAPGAAPAKGAATTPSAAAPAASDSRPRTWVPPEATFRTPFMSLYPAPVRTAANSAAVAPAPAWARKPAATAKPAPAKVFLTADMLKQRQSGAADKRTVELAWNEFLTPNADDLAQQLHLAVKKAPRPALESSPPSATSGDAGGRAKTQASPQVRAQTSSQSVLSSPVREARTPVASSMTFGSSSGSVTEPLPIGVLLDRADDKVTGLVAGLSREGLPLMAFAQTDCVVRNLEALCEALRAGQVARGIVLAPYAAGLMALAGKCQGVRPVQGTRLASVEAGLRQFAANLLVVEHAFSTFHEIRAMIRAFAAAPACTPTDKGLAEALARLDEG